jgi:hypothetical protein
MNENEIEVEQAIFTVHEQEKMIFTECKWEWTVLSNAHLQYLMRNDQERAEKYCSWLLMTGLLFVNSHIYIM